MSRPPSFKQPHPLREIFFHTESNFHLTGYAVLDGAACPDLLAKLEEHQPENCCLYAGELDDGVEEVAPYLVQLDPASPFTDWLLDNIGGKPWGIFCMAPSGIRELRKHFRQFLLVKGPQGENLYFRFYDPRVLSVFFPACDDGEKENILGPIDAYYILSESGGLLPLRRKTANSQ